MKEKEMQTAPCRYCGQIVQFEAEGALTGEMSGEMAALNCDCEDAVAHQIWMRQEKKALSNVRRLFGKEAGIAVSEDVITILNAAVLEICKNELEKISLNLQGGIKATISRNSKGEIKVERTETKKHQLLG